MKLNELRRIKKLYFGWDELARALGITGDSARVAASRYVRQGLLVRVKRNLYILRETWDACGREEKFVIANMGQVPSYISLTTAMDYYGITTQMQQDFFESLNYIFKRIVVVGSLATLILFSVNLMNNNSELVPQQQVKAEVTLEEEMFSSYLTPMEDIL